MGPGPRPTSSTGRCEPNRSPCRTTGRCGPGSNRYQSSKSGPLARAPGRRWPRGSGAPSTTPRRSPWRLRSSPGSSPPPQQRPCSAACGQPGRGRDLVADLGERHTRAQLFAANEAASPDPQVQRHTAMRKVNQPADRPVLHPRRHHPTRRTPRSTATLRWRRRAFGQPCDGRGGSLRPSTLATSPGLPASAVAHRRQSSLAAMESWTAPTPTPARASWRAK